MLSSFRKLLVQNRGAIIQSCVFFVPFFFFVWFWIDPKLIFHEHGHFLMYKIYIPGMNIFADLPFYPDKAVDFLAAVLTHYYYYSWAGALIITALACLLCLGADRVITALGSGKLRLLRFVPPILLLLQYSRYHHFLADGLALLVALLLVYFYVHADFLRTVALRSAVFVVFSAVIYSTAIQAYMVFVVLCIIFEFFKRQDKIVTLLCLISSLLIPSLAGIFIFDLDFIEAYRRTLPFHPAAKSEGIILPFSLFLFFPAVGLGCTLLQYLGQKRKTGRRKARRTGRSSPIYQKSSLKWVLETLVMLIVTAAVVSVTCKDISRRHRRIDFFARHKMWDKLLHEANQLPRHYYDMFVCHDINRALYHTGRLLEDMFSYPQHHSALMLTAETITEGEMLVIRWLKSSNTYFEMGHINEAENSTTEALEMLNYYPVGLQRLAIINIIKGRTDAARIYLHALSRDFVYRDWAQDYLHRLDDDPLLSSDEQIQRLRSFMLTEDSVQPTTPKDLFGRNFNNRMAFEYLMAFCLLTAQTEPVARSVEFLDYLDYPKDKIPRHMEEAVLLHTALAGGSVDLHGRRLNPDTVRRFEKLKRVRSDPRYARDMSVAAEMLEKEFGDTYYCYYLLDKANLPE